MQQKFKTLYRYVLAIGFVISIAYLVYYLVKNKLEDRYNPFAPLSIEHQPSFMTGFKIAGLKMREDACFNVLEESDLKFQRLTDRETSKGCGFFGAVRLQQSSISYDGEITLKCASLVSLAIWEKHDLQPLAREFFNQEINRIRHYGTYACRNINNASSGRRSQHALANAIDIAGFRLEDGTEISVLRDWGQETDTGEFLNAVHSLACKRFATVLGPNYDSKHKDHFHFDQGTFSTCR